jgi:hypothetical protein
MDEQLQLQGARDFLDVCARQQAAARRVDEQLPDGSRAALERSREVLDRANQTLSSVRWIV